MEELLSRFDCLLYVHARKEYDIPGDRHTTRIEFILAGRSRLIAYESYFYDTGRTKYSYQWMAADNSLIQRWDNAHEVTGLITSPHHQHVGSEENVQPSEPMTLEKVLTIIASQLTSD